jgi:hypothetical protein
LTDEKAGPEEKTYVKADATTKEKSEVQFPKGQREGAGFFPLQLVPPALHRIT